MKFLLGLFLRYDIYMLSWGERDFLNSAAKYAGHDPLTASYYRVEARRCADQAACQKRKLAKLQGGRA